CFCAAKSSPSRRTSTSTSIGQAASARRAKRRSQSHQPGGRTSKRSAGTSCASPVSNAPMEAIILAGGKAERLGDAAGGQPKALVDVGGRPLVAYQVEQLARAGVDRVIVSCSSGEEGRFGEALDGIGP